MFEKLSNKADFVKTEKEILEFWQEKNIFKKSIQNHQEQEKQENPKEFHFYDGPPFATGLPHYGHLLASTIKDIIPRYQTMRGNVVQRKFGWDCHGIPVEMEIQNKLNLKSNHEVEQYGVENFNEECRSIVLRYTKEWKETVARIGRWVDFDNGYKTMDESFMESVWAVFKMLYDKKLIYRGFKVMPYSWKAATTLSNFEANQNYKDVQDPAITVKFECKEEENTYFLAWTTTPWTLTGNAALCVNATIDYVKIHDLEKNEFYYLAKNRVSAYFKEEKKKEKEGEKNFEIIEEMKGEKLSGKKYKNLLKKNKENVLSILKDSYVTDDNGTGIVHIAPTFGEDDYRVFFKNNKNTDINSFNKIDEDGNFKEDIEGLNIKGKNIKESDKDIIAKLKEENKLFKQDTIQHSYPFCWRTDTPLMYRAISTWFVNVEKIKSEMIKNNQSINWQPDHIKNGRFGKWLENAKDWAIGRNRYWGTPIPIWQSEDGDILCYGSIEQLEKDSGQKIDDLHKHFVDKIVIKKNGKKYHRVTEVLDCWFESGSMPYAQSHYPFKNKESFEKQFPANFIAEGLDQTRGWFYTLLVLSTALFNKAPFKNVIVNGLILAEDGKKMSKRLKNYPDPNFVLEQYGADALRTYMINSNVVKAESLKFSENGIKEILKNIMIPLWNCLSFFTTYANLDGYHYEKIEVANLKNSLDRWIFSYKESLIKKMTTAMDNYQLDKAVPPLVLFIEQLTNSYIRRCRRRFWKTESDEDKKQAYFTLYSILKDLAKLIAPFMPFIAEKIYSVLKTEQDLESVHLNDYPIYNQKNIEEELEQEMFLVGEIISLARSIRLQHKLKVRQPLKSLTIISQNDFCSKVVKNNIGILKEELNMKEIIFSKEEDHFVSYSAKINFKILGKKYGAKVNQINKEVMTWNSSEIASALQGQPKTIVIEEQKIILNSEELDIRRVEKTGFAIANKNEITCAIDTELDEELILEGISREVVNRIQKFRKEMDLEYDQEIDIQYCCPDEKIKKSIFQFSDYILKETIGIAITEKENLQNALKEEINEKEIFFVVVEG